MDRKIFSTDSDALTDDQKEELYNFWFEKRQACDELSRQYDLKKEKTKEDIDVFVEQLRDFHFWLNLIVNSHPKLVRDFLVQSKDVLESSREFLALEEKLRKEDEPDDEVRKGKRY